MKIQESKQPVQESELPLLQNRVSGILLTQLNQAFLDTSGHAKAVCLLSSIFYSLLEQGNGMESVVNNQSFEHILPMTLKCHNFVFVSSLALLQRLSWQQLMISLQADSANIPQTGFYVQNTAFVPSFP